MAVIETFELTKRYGTRRANSVLAVDQASFTVEQGQVFGFLGPNGSGKTTTIGMLVGIINPTGGTFRLFGASEPRDLVAARARVGATLETPNFYPYLSGRDNLRVDRNGIKSVGQPRIEECLELVGLADRAKHRFKTYSLGMKQRLALAATMLNDPELIILDEPANGLDPQGMREIREIIGILAGRGKTIFLSSHPVVGESNAPAPTCRSSGREGIVVTGTVEEVVSSGTAAFLRAEDVDALEAALGEYPGGVIGAPAGRRGRRRPSNPTTLASLNRYLAGQGIHVSHLAPYRQSLEDAFMDLTEGDFDSMTEIAIMSGAVRQNSSPPEADRGSRLGVLRMLARIEALKTTKRLAFWVTTGIFAAFMVMFAIDMVRSAIRRPNATFALPDSWPEILQPPGEHRPLLPRRGDDPALRPRVLVADRTAECHRRAEQGSASTRGRSSSSRPSWRSSLSFPS